MCLQGSAHRVAEAAQREREHLRITSARLERLAAFGRQVGQRARHEAAGRLEEALRLKDKFGGKVTMLGNVVQTTYVTNLPFAAAVATIPVVIVLLYLLAVRRSGALDNL